MALEVKFTKDIADMLAGVAYGMLAAGSGRSYEYERGVTDTIRAVAEASGVDWGKLHERIRRAMKERETQ
jgi:hypothetical protein